MTEEVEQRWVGVNEGLAGWTTAAGEVLTEVASHYLGVITYADLAEQVQSRTGLRTQSPSSSWIGTVLGQLVARTRAAGLPVLTSLVVRRVEGGVEPDAATVRARLACYRRFADDVPADVIAEIEAAAAAERALAEDAAVREARPPTRAEEPPAICPTCFMQLPASGICDSCG